MNYYVNKYLKNTERLFPMQDRYDFYRYDMNENPEGLPKEFVASVISEITPKFLSIYPETKRFEEKYAKFVGVNSENILTTNGSDMAIRYLLETFGEQGKEVITVSPSFEMYRVNCNILGLKHVPINYNLDFTISIEKILSSINNNTRIVVLLNPNNPVGNAYQDSEVESIINHCQDVGAIVIIDEAYHYFYSKTFLDKTRRYDNVIILRTFSKLFSIAACRLGIIISNKTIINYVKKSRLTFDVNSIALLFAERILDKPNLITNLIETAQAGKNYILNALNLYKYEYKDCLGNFILIKTKNDPLIVSNILESEYKILVHHYSNELLRRYLRVSTGSVGAMEFFLEFFLKADSNI